MPHKKRSTSSRSSREVSTSSRCSREISTSFLCVAVENNDEEEAKKLLANSHCNVNGKNKYGNPLLYIATAKGNVNLVEALLAKKADPNQATKYGVTPLFVASQYNKLQIVKMLLKCNAQVDIKNNAGDTALMIAAQNGHIDVVRLLLEQGAKIDAKNNEGDTALIRAAERGHVDVVRLLLEKGSQVDAKNNKGKTALMSAALVRHDDVVRLLLEQGAQIDAKNNSDYTALMIAAGKGYIDVVRLLLAQGAQIDAKNNDGYTALMIAAAEGHIDVARLLLAQGAQIDAKNNSDYTALMIAARKGYIDVVRLLLAQGAQIDAKNILGHTALMIAAKEGHVDVVRLLLAQGAQIEAKSNEGLGLTALMEALGTGHINVVRLLLEHGAQINVQDTDGNTLLMCAAAYGRVDIVRLLLEHGAQIDAQNNHGFSVLMAAVAGGVAVLHALLENRTQEQRQALFAQTNDMGQNAITFAFENGYINARAVLQEYGAVLPEQLHVAVLGLNQGQSTHEVSVHESVSSSALALASQYLPDISKEAREALLAWFKAEGDLNEQTRKELKENAVKTLKKALEKESAKAYIEQHIELLVKFAGELKEADCQFEDYNDLKVASAKKAIERLIGNEGYRKFKDGRSKVPMILALALVWDGVWDQENTGLMENNEKGELANPVSEQVRREILVQAFYEMERGYNLNDNGKEVNPKAENKVICVPGHFNKAISALAGGRHPLVSIIIATKETAMLRLQALIGEHYLKFVPANKQQLYFKDIQEHRLLPKEAWQLYLKEPLTKLLKEEYQSFVESGMLSQAKIEEAIGDTISTMLPPRVVKKMLKPFSIGKEITDMEIDELNKLKQKINPYDLAQKINSEKMGEDLTPVRAIAHGYGIELSRIFSLSQYKHQITNSTLRNKILIKANKDFDELLSRKRKREDKQENKQENKQQDELVIQFKTVNEIYQELLVQYPEEPKEKLMERAKVRYEKQEGPPEKAIQELEERPCKRMCFR